MCVIRYIDVCNRLCLFICRFSSIAFLWFTIKMCADVSGIYDLATRRRLSYVQPCFVFTSGIVGREMLGSESSL